MTDAISGLFGKPKTPTLVQQPKPVEKITQDEAASQATLKKFAKLRRATIFSSGLGKANIGTPKLGVG